MLCIDLDINGGITRITSPFGLKKGNSESRHTWSSLELSGDLGRFLPGFLLVMVTKKTDACG
jgi:hypothetical protein